MRGGSAGRPCALHRQKTTTEVNRHKQQHRRWGTSDLLSNDCSIVDSSVWVFSFPELHKRYHHHLCPPPRRSTFTQHVATGASPTTHRTGVWWVAACASAGPHAHVPPAAPTAARFLDTYCNMRFRIGCGAPLGCNGVRCRHDGGKGGGQSHTDAAVAATLTHCAQARTPHTVSVPSPPRLSAAPQCR